MPLMAITPAYISNRADLIKLLRAHGITPTQQRVEIGMILFHKAQHLSAEQVLQHVSSGRSKVSKATVYNTLGLFASKSLLREVVVDPCKRFYDTNHTPHHHFFYQESGKLADIHAAEVHIDRLPELPDGTEVDGVDVVIRLRHR